MDDLRDPPSYFKMLSLLWPAWSPGSGHKAEAKQSTEPPGQCVLGAHARAQRQSVATQGVVVGSGSPDVTTVLPHEVFTFETWWRLQSGSRPVHLKTWSLYLDIAMSSWISLLSFLAGSTSSWRRGGPWGIVMKADGDSWRLR